MTSGGTDPSEVLLAARVLAREGLVDAFGHLSVRRSVDRAELTPPRPLGSLRDDEALVELPLDADALPPGVPKEAWIHWAVYRRRPEVGAVCRAQPPSPIALAAAGLPLRALHGQGGLLGAQVPVFDDARLVRERARGDALADALGDAPAVVMRGNGAIAVGRDVGQAVARMWLLERSAAVNLAAAAAGTPRPLSPEELTAWEAAGDELLGRLWDYLRGPG